MRKRISIDDWLMTETVRHAEEGTGRRGDDETALKLATLAGARPDTRLVARARALPGAEAVQGDVSRLRGLMARLAVVLVGLGLLGGWLAARAGISDREIDILLISFTLLGFPSLMLLVWFAFLLASFRGQATAGILGRLLTAGLVRLAPRLLSSPLAAEVTRAGIGLLRTPFGRWYLSTLSHLFWLAYAGGALLTLIIFFSIVQYDLGWGTTLLRDETIIAMIEAAGAMPSVLGIMPQPDPAWIAAGREGGLAGTERATWARFLLALVVVYGALPRMVLGLFCAGMAASAARNLTLDRKQPGYLRLMPLLNPAPTTSNKHGEAPALPPPRPRRVSKKPAGPAILVGIELERPDADWPPSIPGIELRPLGRADRRSQRQEILAALKALSDPPPTLLAVCSLLRTPDSGTAELLNRLADAADSALILVLDEQSLLTERGGDPAARRADWEGLAERVGGQAIVIDLDRPDAASLARLKQWVGESA
ncbi:MAG: DUF2868 domain-containing protein [Wenzhouxiangella sp.]